jgi:hypothetical protein
MIEAIFMATWLSVITEPFINDISAATNSQIIAKSVEYEGETITFQHMLWRIREDSVCGGHAGMTPVYSGCTVKAKQLFHELCNYLTSNKTNERYRRNYQQMYCNAAVSYKPTIIQISKGNEAVISEKERLIDRCNQFATTALINRDESSIRKRDIACEKSQNYRNNDQLPLR